MKGGVAEGLNISNCSTTTSIWPVVSLRLSWPSGRWRTVPRTARQNSLRMVWAALWAPSSVWGLNTT